MGLLATAEPAATTEALLYTCPTARAAVVNLMVSNNGSSESVVTVSPSTQSTAPLSSEAIERAVGAGDLLEITAISLSAGQKIFIKSSAGGVTFNCWGLEEIA